MDAPPVNLYSCKDDAAQAVLALLIETFPEQEIEVDSPDGEWSVELTICTTGRIFKKELKLKFHHNPDYYSGPEWATQQQGMIGYFSQVEPPEEQFGKVQKLIHGLRFNLSIQATPAFDDEDERHGFISYLAEKLDACIFLPGALLDSQFRSLITVDGSFDSEAVFPDYPSDIEIPATESSASDPDDEEEEIQPPSAERVAKRLLVLLGMVGRSVFEMQYANKPEIAEALEQLRELVGGLPIRDEFEDAEWETFNKPIAQLTEQETIDNLWRTESIAMLAWALGLHELSAYDEATETAAIFDELGFLNKEQAEAILSGANLRPEGELRLMAEQQLSLHWRIRDFSIRPEKCDFKNWGGSCWFGPTDLSWANFGADNDIALQGTSITSAEPDLVSSVSSATMERHLAINWLLGYAELYSETDTST